MTVDQIPAVLGILGLMFYLLQFGKSLNLETSGRGFIDINTLAKSVFAFLSFVLGIPLTVLLYAIAAGDVTWLDQLMVIMMNYWIFLTCFLLLFFLMYFLIYLPRLFYKVR